MKGTDALIASLRQLEAEGWDLYREELRIADRHHIQPSVDPDEDVGTAMGHFLRSDPGQPLGPGMPEGSPLREDGESHRDAWKRIVRADPCAYCKFSQSWRLPPDEDFGMMWSSVPPGTRYTGACSNCNGNKGSTPILIYMRKRARQRDRFRMLKERVKERKRAARM